MKKFLLSALLLSCGFCSQAQETQTPLDSQKPQDSQLPLPPKYSDVWRPISDEGIVNEVARSYNDGVALDGLALRAGLANKQSVYLQAVRKDIDTYDDNATLMAAYARGLQTYRFGMTFYGAKPERAMPKDFTSEDISDWIDKAKAKQPTCWLAYVAECEWIPGSGYGGLHTMRTEAAKAAQKAFDLQQNPVTTTTLVWALGAQAWSENVPDALKHAKEKIELGEQKFQGNVKMDTCIYQFYSFVPAYMDKPLGQKKLDLLIATIPPNLRETQPVVNYLTWNNWSLRK